MPSGDTKKVHFSWNETFHAIDLIKELMRRSKYKPERVLALGKGGMIPARLLAPEGVPCYYVGVSSYKGERRGELAFNQALPPFMGVVLNLPTTLVVDDLWDSGQTFEWVKNLFPKVTTAALLTKTGEHSLDYVYRQMYGNPWIVFPWEK